MYKTMEEILNTKKTTVKEPKQPHLYIWKGQKGHFRGPVEFKENDMIETLVDMENNKILFINNGVGKYCRKYSYHEKTKNYSMSFKKLFAIMKVEGTSSYVLKKLTDDEKKELNIDVNRIAYEVDLNNPITD